MKTIHLTQGKRAVVDDEDYERVEAFTWCAVSTVCSRRIIWYAMSRSQGRRSLMHRVILGISDRRVLVDHRDGDGLNNRRDNLRPCTTRQNALARHTTQAISGLRGVHFDGRYRRRPWIVYVRGDGRARYVGCFATRREAAAAWAVAASAAYGEFANVIPPAND